MRNVGSALAQRKLTRSIISCLNLAGIKYCWRNKKNNIWTPGQSSVDDADIEMGKALKKLLDSNTLIIGSGFSFHNMMVFSQEENTTDTSNDEFQNWLIDTTTKKMPQEVRENLLINWEQAPHARYCHPREEHLLPLHVCTGLAGREGSIVFDNKILGKRSIAVAW